MGVDLFESVTECGCAGWPMARLQRDPRMLAVLSGATGLASIGFGLVIGSPLVWRWLF